LYTLIIDLNRWMKSDKEGGRRRGRRKKREEGEEEG